jgi:hypothetical protein
MRLRSCQLSACSISGMQFTPAATASAWNANQHHQRAVFPEYFGLQKGVSSYTLVANHVPVNAKIIGTHEHESRDLKKKTATLIGFQHPSAMVISSFGPPGRHSMISSSRNGPTSSASWRRWRTKT